MSDNYDNTPTSYFEEDMRAIIDGTQFPSRPPKSKMEELLKELNDTIKEGGGGGGGTTNYNLLQNKPSINSVTLTGDKSLEDLNIPTAADLAGKQDALPVTASGNDVAFNGDIQDGQGNTLSVLAEALTKTASGNPVVIDDCAGGKARSLKTTIEAIQDLHGYDHPWAGGAGKNFIDYSARHSSSVGNTYTYDEYDGWIKEEWASGGQHQLVLSIPFVERLRGNKVTISITSADISNQRMSDWRIFLLTYINGGSESIVATLNPATNLRSTITLNDNITEMRVLLRMSQNGTQSLVAGDNIVFHGLQLEVSESPTSFAPYSNICPISGRTSVTITNVDAESQTTTVTIQLGQTVYGGTLNVTTGVLTIDRAYVKAKDLTWHIQSSAYARFTTPSLIDTIKKSNTDYMCISDSYESRSNQDSLTNYNQIYSNASGDVKIGDVEYASSTIEQWLAARGETEIVYELATPITIQLTPTQLQMLKGYNRVSIDNGSIELGYAANVQAEVDVLETAKADNADVVDYIENGNTASRAYTVNQFMLWKGDLYKVTTSIASGATITAGTNVSKTTIGAVLTAILNS